jgi:sulfite reductase (ferredoxin)
MNASDQSWKTLLEGRIPDALGHEIDSYEQMLEQKQRGEIDDPNIAEQRLRRGVYGQRYDNGQRNDGNQTVQLNFPRTDLTKGPGTKWEAPGMMRIKIPFGGMTADQMDVMADLAEEYADDILHITTRQDIQLHYVHIDDTPDLMRRLGAVGITTREACGNSVRNVTACPRAGVCSDEVFDVTPYADAATQYLLGHPDVQDFGRKLKIAFSGCAEGECGLVGIHDVGGIARVENVDGVEKRGFEIYVGGGLGPVPYHALLLDEFVPEEELLPVFQAISRVFARLGEKKNRARARIKFLVANVGIEEFKRLVIEEREKLPNDPRWTAYLQDLHPWDEPSRPAALLSIEKGSDPGYDSWRGTNVMAQRQPGYTVVAVNLPLGDLTANQTRALAEITRTYNGGTARNTVEQNIVLRWIPEADLPDIFTELDAAGLARTGAGTISDITSCPGTDTCKLGIASSRGLAKRLQDQLEEQRKDMDPAVSSLRIKVSGCFNACGQHHIADIGFWGVSRKKGTFAVPHFQVVLGGERANNVESYGLAIGAAPSKNVPAVVDRITSAYLEERESGESFHAFVDRKGKSDIRGKIEDLFVIPEYEDAPDYYSDWGDPRVFTIGDIGIGECAGEVVASIDFDLMASEREVFQAQDRFDQDDVDAAAEIAYRAMVLSAKALVKTQNETIEDDAESVMSEFRTRFYDTEVFYDPFVGAKFARYYLRVHDEIQSGEAVTRDLALRRIGEAQLFVEAAHACYGRLSQEAVQ